ncbi:MAG TPA: decaprenyl-phosphate phosphoribosyltransferase [Dehalococcoidia bacterium]|nr:decaprenyl-phosphate phosphoribosyltransferase [Dehalococcoidia bacterium]
MANDEAVLTAAETPLAASARARGAAGIIPLAGYLLKSMRPRQWTKNGIVFLALIFSVGQEYHLGQPDTWVPKLLESLVAFACFALVSSADYLVNDIRDIEQDRVHPRKSRRPIAAGLLPVNVAWGAAVVLAVVGNAGAFALDWKTGLVILAYTGLMVAYSYRLKHVVLLDLMVIAAGFVLRAMAGALAIDVPISPWLYVVTALGALFLGINKRRAELELLQDGAGNHRKILDEYSLELLDQMASTVTAATLMAYGLYTFTAEGLPKNHSMMLTIPFVLYGIFRYLYLVNVRKEGGSPEDVLLKDVPIILCIAGWIATAGIVLLVARE